MVKFPFELKSKMTCEKFKQYVEAHHDGDVDEAIVALLLEHKVVHTCMDKMFRAEHEVEILRKRVEELEEDKKSHRA